MIRVLFQGIHLCAEKSMKTLRKAGASTMIWAENLLYASHTCFYRDSLFEQRGMGLGSILNFTGARSSRSMLHNEVKDGFTGLQFSLVWSIQKYKATLNTLLTQQIILTLQNDTCKMCSRWKPSHWRHASSPLLRFIDTCHQTKCHVPSSMVNQLSLSNCS